MVDIGGRASRFAARIRSLAILHRPSVESERRFEQELILGQRDRYLATDVVEKITIDPGYRSKVELIQENLQGVTGWILDIGANTCGESEYLSAQGYRMLATDINEKALEISRERTAIYNRPAPTYVAADAHRLPFDDGIAAFIVIYEALHHLPDPLRALHEAHRVLEPGGGLLLYEPYAYNPYRRLAEFKDRLRRGGTIERSFSVHALSSLLSQAGFPNSTITRNVHPASEWKIAGVSSLHGVLKRLYHRVSARVPWLFGNLVAVAVKTGVPTREARPLTEILRCPACRVSGLVKDKSGWVCTSHECRRSFPDFYGIPVLIVEDSQQKPLGPS